MSLTTADRTAQLCRQIDNMNRYGDVIVKMVGIQMDIHHAFERLSASLKARVKASRAARDAVQATMPMPELPEFITADVNKLGVIHSTTIWHLYAWADYLTKTYPGVKTEFQTCLNLPIIYEDVTLLCHKCWTRTSVFTEFARGDTSVKCQSCQAVVERSDSRVFRYKYRPNCLIFGPTFGYCGYYGKLCRKATKSSDRRMLNLFKPTSGGQWNEPPCQAETFVLPGIYYLTPPTDTTTTTEGMDRYLDRVLEVKN